MNKKYYKKDLYILNMTNISYTDIVENSKSLLLKRQESGIRNAQNGKREEQIICENFNGNMKYLIEKFSSLRLGKFKKYPGRTKTDVYAKIKGGKTLNIQVKRYTKSNSNIHRGGQVGKLRWRRLVELIPDLGKINRYMSAFFDLPIVDKICDKSKQIKLNMYDSKTLKFITKKLNDNKRKILETILLGSKIKERPKVFCGIEYSNKIRNKITLFTLDNLINYLMKFEFTINNNGNRINLGDSFFIQRKGGDRGRSGANCVQFRIIFYKLNINENKKFVINL